MTDELLRDRERPGDDPAGDAIQVLAEPTQLLTGLEIGLPTNRVVCVGCGDQLGEGRAVTVYGYRQAERDEWDLRRCYCEACAPTAIETPTLGVSELLARAWLGSVALPRTRTHRLCLTEVELVTYSPPAEGCEP
jgi:hypothetical protein